MMRYTIVKHDTLEACVARVNALLAEGWVLQGGVAMCNVPWEKKDLSGYERHYAQAMYHAGLKPTQGSIEVVRAPYPGNIPSKASHEV